MAGNRKGIFMTHIRSRDEPYTAQQWRLSRSEGRGKAFTIIFEATHATNPPVVETDARDNIYLIRPDFLDGSAYLYRFLASENYARPHISTVPSGSAGKYSMIYDAKRKRLCYFAHNDMFFIIGPDGAVKSSWNLLKPGPNAVVQYPLLFLEPDGTLHAAWTTQKNGVYLYWDIHHILSRDGGVTWQKMDGTLLALPVIADETGPSERITPGDKFDVHTWLFSLIAKGGKAHFFYSAQTSPPREHYIRYDSRTGRREIDLFPKFGGQAIFLMNLDGFSPRAPECGKRPLTAVPCGTGESSAPPAMTTGRHGTITQSARNRSSLEPMPSADAAS
ncbi:MAG: BNR-4 repeat-containing protein [Armatimonadetes bacterium]|nr:BNR-4 repeat-containing protein [Armatimonadota bacterium]